MKKILFLFGLAALLPACAPETADRYNTAENENEAVTLLNEHKYDKAVWLIENRNGTVPSDPKIRFILAQAYLGKAGIEPLLFAAKVSGEQPESPELKGLFPKCGAERLETFKGADPLCIVKRVYAQAPDADKRDLARARDLFVRAYPDAATAPPWANTLIGVVETVSVIQRAGKIYAYARKYKEDGKAFDPVGFVWLAKQVGLAESEGKEALNRAKYSGDKVSRLVSGINGDQLFDHLKDKLKFKAQTGLEKITNNLETKNPTLLENNSYQTYLDGLNDFLDESGR